MLSIRYFGILVWKEKDILIYLIDGYFIIAEQMGQDNDKRIVAGIIDVQAVLLRQDILIDNFTVHPDFNNITLENDICLLYLETEIEFNERAQPIPMAYSLDSVGTDCVIAGWGKVRYEKLSQNCPY